MLSTFKVLTKNIHRLSIKENFMNLQMKNLICFVFLLGLFSCQNPSHKQLILIQNGSPISVFYNQGQWEENEGALKGQGVRNFLFSTHSLKGKNFELSAKLKLSNQKGSAASFFIGENHFGFEGAKETLYLNGPLFGGLKLLGSPEDYFKRGEWFEFSVKTENQSLNFFLNGKKAYSVSFKDSLQGDLGFSPWRSTMYIKECTIKGDFISFDPPKNETYSIPTLDLASDQHRQIVVDREKGQYLGHPTTVLLEDNKTILCVYPKGHGRGGIVYKKSTDGGLTWSNRIPTPDNWKTSKEVPTIHRVVDKEGKKRLIMWSGLYPARLAVSENDGETWSPLKKVGDWGGIVVMGFVEKLKKPGHYLAMFHDDGRFFTAKPDRKSPVEFKLFKTFSTDGGLTWSYPEVVQKDTKVHLCEPGCIRSPDGKQLAVLLRENSRRKNSYLILSNDEGKTWSEPKELPASLTGDRHTGKYLKDGRLFISFRDTTHVSPTKGDWVAWVGTYEDIVKGREGQYRVRLMDNHVRGDCAYPGVEVLPDQTIVTTTYGHWTKGESPYIMSVRLKLSELDAMFKAKKGLIEKK